MPWTLTDDVDLYAGRVWPLLAGRPVLHTLPLTVIETLRTGHRWSAEPVVLGWFTADQTAADGQAAGVPAPVTGVVSMTPPYDLLLAEVPDDALSSLVTTLREASVAVPGIRGPAALAAAFSARWRLDTPIVESGGEHERLYALGELVRPAGVDGRARLATMDDADVVIGLWDAFQLESGLRPVDTGPLVRGRIDAGLVWLWECDRAAGPTPADFEVVSMAARNGIAADVSRVGPVYTPPEHRRHGYAAAVTAACSQDARDSGAGNVVLFTDLDNPTANSVYQSIGYAPVTDFETILFA